MPREILMPKLGLTMKEGLLVEWKKAEGDAVALGDILFVLETEKVTYEVEATEEGSLGRIVVHNGTTVPVGAVVGWLLLPGESAEDLPSAEAGPSPAPTEVSAPAAPLPASAPPPLDAAGGGTRVRSTPYAKKLARELGVELGRVQGSGSAGRIMAEDVRRTAAAGPTPAAPRGREELVPFSAMRKAIAKNMMFSKTQTAQTYMSVSADAGAMVSQRQALLAPLEERFRARITITDLMMKVVGAALAAHPVINTRWSDQGVLYLPEVHMGMAMALKAGLIVPVIREINRKSLGQVARERNELIGRCRSGRFLPDDITGSTFTLSSLGMYGIESFTANINPPEAAILAVGAIVNQVVAREGQVLMRPMVNLTLTYDHRIIDGAEAGKFMQTIKNLVEEPVGMMALEVVYV